MIQASHQVAQNCFLCLVPIMDAKLQVALARILCAHGDRRQHHDAQACLFEQTVGGIECNFLRKNAIGQVGQMLVVRFGGRGKAQIAYEASHSTDALFAYAKQLEEAGSDEAAKAVYDLIDKTAAADGIYEGKKSAAGESPLAEAEELLSIAEKLGGR